MILQDCEKIADLGIQIATLWTLLTRAASSIAISSRPIFLPTDRGHAEILDFGLAKVAARPRRIVPQAVAAGWTLITEMPEVQLTSLGTALGTVARS